MNRQERYIDILAKDAPAIADVLGEVIRTATLPSGRKLTGLEWGRIVEQYKDRMLGKVFVPIFEELK